MLKPFIRRLVVLLKIITDIKNVFLLGKDCITYLAVLNAYVTGFLKKIFRTHFIYKLLHWMYVIPGL